MAGNSYRDYQRRVEARRLGRPDPVRGYDHGSDDSEGDGKKELHHLSIHGHPDATKERPMWLVQHHSGDDSEPEEHEFSDGVAMLHHIGKHASVPGFREEENSEEEKK